MPESSGDQVTPEHEHIVEAARRVEQSRRDDLRHLVLIILGVVVLLFAVVFAFGFGALLEVRGVLHKIEDQNEKLDASIADARVVAARNDEQLERILAGISSNLVPREDVLELKAEVRQLQEDIDSLRQQNRKLTRAVNDLTRAVNRQDLGGG